jgi:diguanylate cyclase (GGDEF)-like protein
VYEFTYRRIKDGRSFYVKMRVSRVEEDPRFVVLAVMDVDELMKKRQAEERMLEERTIYARLHALTGNFVCVYVVDPESGEYREFSSSAAYQKSFAQAKGGTDFFGTVREAAHRFNHPEDLSLFLSTFTKENVMAEIQRSGIFTLAYRLVMNGKPLHVQLKAAMVEEKEGLRLIVGINDIDAQVRQEEELGRRLALARSEANRDALTGVKNRHAYLEFQERMDRQILEGTQPPFAIVMLDVNDLKKTNDTRGHQAGDQLIRDACRIVCTTFQHSPVFRVGGDEFAVISQGSDFEHIEELVESVNRHNAEALRTGGVVVACGMSRFDQDQRVTQVFARADRQMYENKTMLKRWGKGE